MANLRCYHHCNCEDRPAVAQCSVCGKGLCRECADKLTSPNTGKLLCADCLNKEIAADEAWANKRRARMRREMITIIIGFILGLAIEIFLGVMMSTNGMDSVFGILFVLSMFLFLPTLLASFGTITGTVTMTFENWFLRFIFFVILVIGSPIMFVVRLVKRARVAKQMKLFAAAQERRRAANQEYKELAAKMNTRLESMEEFERKLTAKFAQMVVVDREKAAAEMEKERAIYKKQLDEQTSLAQEAQKRADEVTKANIEIAQAMQNIEKENQRNKSKAKARGRSDDRISG